MHRDLRAFGSYVIRFCLPSIIFSQHLPTRASKIPPTWSLSDHICLVSCYLCQAITDTDINPIGETLVRWARSMCA